MCKNRPGPRCSDHSRDELERLGTKYAVYLDRLKAAEAELAHAIDNGLAIKRITARVERFKELAQHAGEKAEKAEISYHSTPAGQRSLQERIDSDATDEDEKLFLQEEKLMTAALRKWQNQVYRELRDVTKKHGAAEALMRAQVHINNRQEELLQVREEMLRAQEAAKNPPPTPPASSSASIMKTYQQTMASYRKARRFLRSLKRYQFVIALMTDDLDNYIKRNGKKMGEKAFMGAMKLAVRPLER